MTGDTVSELGHVTSPRGDSFTAYRVVLAPGEEFSYWFTLSNQGSLGVTVTDIRGEATLLGEPIDVRIQVKPSWGDAPLRAFRSFSFAPDDYVDVLVTVQLIGCVPEGNATSIGSVEVDYRVLGIPNSTRIYLPESIEITGPHGARCS